MARFEDISAARAAHLPRTRSRLTPRPFRAQLPPQAEFRPAEAFALGHTIGGVPIVYVEKRLVRSMADVVEKSMPFADAQSFTINWTSTDEELAAVMGHRMGCPYLRAFELMELSQKESACVAAGPDTNWLYVGSPREGLTPLFFWRSRGGWMISAVPFGTGFRTGVLHLPE